MFTVHAAWAADNSWQRLQDSKVLTIGFCAHYPPFESRNEQTNELEGFDVGLGRALAENLGVKSKFVDAEWQGLLGGLKKGDYDVLITCMSKSEARADQANMSDVYYRLPDVIVVKDSNTAIRTKDDLTGKIVGVQIGSGSEQIADKMAADFKDIKRYNYNPEAFTDLAHGRIDAVIVGYAYAVTQIKKTPAFKVAGSCRYCLSGYHSRHFIIVSQAGIQTGSVSFKGLLNQIIIGLFYNGQAAFDILGHCLADRFRIL